MSNIRYLKLESQEKIERNRRKLQKSISPFNIFTHFQTITFIFTHFQTITLWLFYNFTYFHTFKLKHYQAFTISHLCTFTLLLFHSQKLKKSCPKLTTVANICHNMPTFSKGWQKISFTCWLATHWI